jgi:hypothetical protein
LWYLSSKSFARCTIWVQHLEENVSILGVQQKCLDEGPLQICGHSVYLLGYYTPIIHALAICLSQSWQITHASKKILATNEVRQYAPKGAHFFSFGEGWGCWIFIVFNMFPLSFQCVPMKFPMCSWSFQFMFLNMYPTTPHFIPHPWLLVSVILETYITSPMLGYYLGLS